MHSLRAEWEQERDLIEFDLLLERLQRWSDEGPPIEIAERARLLLQRLKPRLQQARLHLDDVLVVGVVGGTGTGKSTLVNALVGEPVCPVGVQRPTTMRPQVVCRQGTELTLPEVEMGGVVVHQRDLPLLDHMVLIDCPDPDTQSSADTGGTNRNRDILRAVLPHCDVIVYVASQEKYKSQVVSEELQRHAPGAHLVFVQSKAGVDADIRSDWRQTLVASGFAVSDIFRVDAEDALARQAQGQAPDPEFVRLTHLLEQQLAARARHRIKRANILDLYDWMFDRIEDDWTAQRPALEKLDQELQRHHETMRLRLRQQLERHLRTHRAVWRAKVLERIQEQWGGGPFAALLRLFGGGSALLRWLPLSLARNPTQLAITGSVAAATTLRNLWQQQQAAHALTHEAVLGVAAADVHQARTVLEGYAYDAGLGPMLETRVGAEREQFVDAALAEMSAQLQRRIETALTVSAERVVDQHAGPVLHGVLEVAFALLPVLVLYQLGRDFFYEHLLLSDPNLLGFDYLLQSVLWIFAWGWGLRGVLIWRLNRGLRREVTRVADEVCTVPMFTALSADMRHARDTVQRHRLAFTALRAELDRLQQHFGTVELHGVGRRVAHAEPLSH